VLGVRAPDRGAPPSGTDHRGADHDPGPARGGVQETEVPEVRLALRESDRQDLAEVTARRMAARWLPPAVLVGVVYVAVFLFYELIYRVRHFSLPLGFDAPWYVWRADFVASQGVGPLLTNARPGQELLTGNLHSVTGLSAVQLQVVLPYVLVGVFALALGALV